MTRRAVGDGVRNIKALDAALSRAIGTGNFPAPLLGNLSMLSFDLKKGMALLTRLLKFRGTAADADELFFTLALHLSDLAVNAKELVPHLKRLQRTAAKQASQDRRAARPRSER